MSKKAAKKKGKAPVVIETAEEPKDTSKDTAAASSKLPHPLMDKVGKYPFAALPEDYDFSAHVRLVVKDFANKAAYYDYRALDHQTAADGFKAKADEERKGGGNAGAKARKMLANFAETTAEMQDAGIDTAELQREALKAIGMTPESAAALLQAQADAAADAAATEE